MGRVEIKIGGFGGQGIILSGIIIGKAAALFDEKAATMTQSFGPEARGSACSAQVIISDEEILYPYVLRPDVLVVLSQEAFDRFAPEMKPDGLLIYEKDLVRTRGPAEGARTFGVPATRIAGEIGRAVVVNIVMCGFVCAVAGVPSFDALRRAMIDSVPHGTVPLNTAALERGYAYGIDKYDAALRGLRGDDSAGGEVEKKTVL
jgi:2-oxoglutarate ferredoxin oxidoreductase subunit gamma